MKSTMFNTSFLPDVEQGGLCVAWGRQEQSLHVAFLVSATRALLCVPSLDDGPSEVVRSLCPHCGHNLPCFRETTSANTPFKTRVPQKL